MNALMDFFMRVPKWTLPIIMVAPALFLIIVISATEPTVATKIVTVDEGKIGVLSDPDTTNCERRGVLSEVGEGCIIRIIQTGNHEVPENYHVIQWSLEIITRTEGYTHD